MGVVPVFSGTVDEQGRLHLPHSQKHWRRAHLATLKGREVEVVIRRKRRQRSSKQNSYIHVAATVLAEEFGNEIDEMKWILMGEKWGWKRDERLGREVPVLAHTSDMTVEQATEFIDWLPRWAADKGVLLLAPGEMEL